MADLTPRPGLRIARFALALTLSLYSFRDLEAPARRFNPPIADISDVFARFIMKSRDHDAKLPANPTRNKVGPLGCKTVLVTRPVSQSGEITQLLEESGALVVHCATIEITPPVSWEAIDQAIALVEGYDWVVFTSANGPKFFYDRFAEVRDPASRAPAHQLICAIGPATARAVEAAGARVDLVVKESRAEGVLQAIVQRVGGERAIRGLRFLMPAARHARQYLPTELRKLGAQADVVEAYQTVKPNVDIGALIRRHNIGVITFTSPSTVSNFANMVEADLLEVLRANALAACIGPITTAAAVEQGFNRIVQADAANPKALVEAIARSVAKE